MTESSSRNQPHRHSRDTSDRHVAVSIWNGMDRAPYECTWCPDCSTNDIKQFLDAVLNAEKTWLVAPSDMVFIPTSGRTIGDRFKPGVPRDLEAIKELVIHSHEHGIAVWMRVSRGPVPVFVWMVPVLLVLTVSILAFHAGHQWAQNVFVGLCGHVMARFLVNCLLEFS